MNCKKLIASIFLLFMTCSAVSNALEDIVIHTMPQPDIFPYNFIIDAGISANKYIKNTVDRNLFVSQYASTLKEIVFYKMKMSDFDEDERECKKSKDENYKALVCSRVAAAKAVFEKNIPLDIESFGFVKKSLLGRVKKINDGHGDFFVLETTNGDRWDCILDENLIFSENTLYTIEGFLGPEGAYGTRGDLLKREFLAMKLVKYKVN